MHTVVEKPPKQTIVGGMIMKRNPSKSYVADGLVQSRQDAVQMGTILIAAMFGITTVMTVCAFTVTPESAHNLVVSFHNIVQALGW